MVFLTGSIVTIIVLYFTHAVYCLWSNYQKARATNLPYVITPISPDNNLWRGLGPIFKSLLQRILPSAIYEGLIPTTWGWQVSEKHHYHEKHGKAFLVVSPGPLHLWCSDSVLAGVITQRRKDFMTMPLTKAVIGFLGDNVLTSDGDDWSRQRRLIAPILNERIMDATWTTSCEQARGLSKDITTGQPSGVQVLEGLPAVALNILAQTAYGQERPWSTNGLKAGEQDSEKPMTYFDTIAYIIQTVITVSILPTWILKLPIMPRWQKQAARAVELYPSLVEEALHDERQRLAEGERRNNVLASLITAMDAEKDTSNSLSAEEVRGNLFVFAAAGFETTATTMRYATLLLAMNPKWQDWIHEELDRLMPDNSASNPAYTETFPKFHHLQAIMHETLRLFPAIVGLSRCIDHPQTVTTSQGEQINLPSPMMIYINFCALHKDPDTWGPDSLAFNPLRWITSDGTFLNTAKNSFMPWSAGPRVCPGQKMAQVEFTAVMSTLFRRARVSLVPRSGETFEGVVERMQEILNQSQPILSLQMKSTEGIDLRWEERLS